jgi:hypothetical protein
VTTDVSEERVASIIRVKRISELGTLAVTSSCELLVTLYLSHLFFHTDDRGNSFLRNVGSHRSHTASHVRREHSSCDSMFLALSVCATCSPNV